MSWYAKWILPINITHRGAAREIKNLLRFVNENVPMKQIEDYEIFGLIRYIKERSKYEDHN